MRDGVGAMDYGPIRSKDLEMKNRRQQNETAGGELTKSWVLRL